MGAPHTSATSTPDSPPANQIQPLDHDHARQPAQEHSTSVPAAAAEPGNRSGMMPAGDRLVVFVHGFVVTNRDRLGVSIPVVWPSSRCLGPLPPPGGDRRVEAGSCCRQWRCGQFAYVARGLLAEGGVVIGPRSAGVFVPALRSTAALEDDWEAEIRGETVSGATSTVVVTVTSCSARLVERNDETDTMAFGGSSRKEQTLAALAAASDRLAGLVRSLSATDGSRPIPGLGWTAAETAAHVVTVAGRLLGDRRRSA